jgi:hypothetical protein
MAWRSLLLVVGQEGQDGQEEWLIVWTPAWDASWDTGNKESWSWRDMVLEQQARSTIAGGGGCGRWKRGWCSYDIVCVLGSQNTIPGHKTPHHNQQGKCQQGGKARLITGNRERMQFSVVFLKYD